MNERERLIELLLESEPIKDRDLDDNWYDGEISDIAEYLLENGVVVPPVKIGDVVSVVRCKDCIYFQDRYVKLPDGSKRPYKKGESSVPLSVGINVGSYCTRIDYAIVHGYRHGEPSVDETRLWTEPDDFCSYGEKCVDITTPIFECARTQRSDTK